MARNRSISRMLKKRVVAQLLDTTDRAIDAMIARQKIPYTRIGRRILFDEDELILWLAHHRVITAADLIRQEKESPDATQ